MATNDQTRLRSGANRYGRESLGCFADGGFGHDHVRGVLCTLLQHLFEVECLEASELRALLRAPMSDDGQEEYDAIDLLNAHALEEGLFFELCDGDLLLREESDTDE